MPDPVQTVAPVVKATHVKALMIELRRSGRWLTRRALAALIGDATPSWERRVRAIASVAAPAVLSYPGAPGYIAIEKATDEEIEHGINALRAQGSDMCKRADLYEVALNQRRLARTAKPVQAELQLST